MLHIVVNIDSRALRMLKLLQWAKNLFKKKESVLENKKINKVAIIIGHGNGDSGAMGWNGMSEFNYNSFVADEIERANTGKEIRIFHRGSSGIAGVAAKAMLWKGDITIEMHLNAFNGKAKGCCVLTLKDDVSIKMGRKFSEAFCKKFNRVMRDGDGVVELEKGDRGHFSLACVNDPAPSILIEPFFIDNEDEHIEMMTYANFLIEWIKEL